MNRTAPTKPPGCLTLIVGLIFWFAFMTPAVMIAWNVGLQPSGLMHNQITWVTAFGLSMAITIFRGIVSALRRKTVVVPVPVSASSLLPPPPEERS